MPHRGYVVNVVNCTSGTIQFELVKIPMPIREFPPSILAVHKARKV